MSEVITSICTGVDIVTPTPLPTETNPSGDDSDQIDLNITVVEGEGALITSTAHDSCKTPDQFTVPESQYIKKRSDFTGMDSRYYDKVKLQKDYGINTTWSTPTKSNWGNYNISTNAGGVDKSDGGGKFEPGVVTAIPLFVPDVFVTDEFDGSGKQTFECSYQCSIPSNAFVYNPNNVNTEIGVNRPYLVYWVSATPGGAKLGDYLFFQPPAGTGQIDFTKFRATMSYEQFKEDKAKGSGGRGWNIEGYLGNIYGARWWNVVTLKYQDVKDLNFDIPKAGTTAFVDMFSDKGYTTTKVIVQLPLE